MGTDQSSHRAAAPAWKSVLFLAAIIAHPGRALAQPQPAIDVEKLTNGEDADLPPGPHVYSFGVVQWTFSVTNTGDVAFVSVELVDDALGQVGSISDLSPGTTIVITLAGNASQGQHVNIVTATATTADGTVVTDSDPSHHFGEVPDLAMEKTTNGEDADDAPGPTVQIGSTVVWEYVATNTGNVPLHDVQITDDDLGDICNLESLEVGASLTCTMTGVAVPGQYGNVGSAQGSTADGNVTISRSDRSHYFGADLDADDDGVADGDDLCPDTAIPEVTPSGGLHVNRWALVDGDDVFDTVMASGGGPNRTYTIEDTGGCSCEQIAVELGLGTGHFRFGCSTSVMDSWIAGVDGAGKSGPAAGAAADLPEGYSLGAVYPNPWNPQSRLSLEVAESQHITVRVFDLLGRPVVDVFDGSVDAGQAREFVLNAEGLPTGTYLVRVVGRSFAATRRMVLLK